MRIRLTFPAVILCIGSIAACVDDGTLAPTSPPLAAISDAMHGTGGNPHFYWLPPMITPTPTFSGVFDAAADPTVRVCRGAVSVCDLPVATLTVASGLTMSTVDHWYGGDWYVFDQNLEVEVNDIFRISVSAYGQELGFADLLILDKVTGALKKSLGGDYILLSENNGKKFLKIRFRVEEGIAACAPVPPDLVSWWPGDGNADDIGDAGNHGTLYGGVSYAEGMVGRAFEFDGVEGIPGETRSSLVEVGVAEFPTG
ncbi:MAG: hypothetical protein ABIK89_07720, partial [Planctomycetota bacterium]